MRSHYFRKLQQSEIRWMLNLISDQFGWAWPSSSDYSLAPWSKTSIFDQFSKILLQHKKTIVEGVKVKYHCNSCDFKATYPWQLKQHTEAGHEVSDILVKVGTLLWNMKHRKEIIYVGVRHSCDSGHYNATVLSNLKRHTESMHMGVRHSCDYCDFKAPYQS